jgi:hypothetical protein
MHKNINEKIINNESNFYDFLDGFYKGEIKNAN